MPLPSSMRVRILGQASPGRYRRASPQLAPSQQLGWNRLGCVGEGTVVTRPVGSVGQGCPEALYACCVMFFKSGSCFGNLALGKKTSCLFSGSFLARLKIAW